MIMAYIKRAKHYSIVRGVTRGENGELVDAEVVVDGNITTSYGLGGAIPFALELVRQLAGEAEADRIRNAIAYRHPV